MPQTDIDWTTTEKDLAQAAFEKAYHREVTALVEEVQQTVQKFLTWMNFGGFTTISVLDGMTLTVNMITVIPCFCLPFPN